MSSKGFLFTILTFMLALSVLALASFFIMQKNAVDISAEKTRDVFDDVKTDVEDILQLSSSIERSSGSVTVSFHDRIPLTDVTDVMNRYENFIEGLYSAEINSNIGLAGIEDFEFSIEPYGLTYGYPGYDKEGIRIYNRSGDADSILKYVIEMDFDENLMDTIEYSTPGDLDVEINATFANAVYCEIVSVSRNGNSTWVFDFGESNLALTVGRNIIDSQTRDSSMKVDILDTIGSITTGVVLADVNETFGVKSGIYLSVGGDIARSDYIWLARG